MIETQYITLDMKPSGVLPILYCSQYDIGRPLGMVVYNGGQVVDLGDFSVIIEATRTDGVAITAAVTTDGNIGAFETTATMTNKADRYGAQLVLSASGKRVASLPFVMVVVKATMDENAESIEEDASLYQQYTGTVQTLIADIRVAVNAEASARASADSSLQSAIASEASTRAAADQNLQSQIDQIIAPSGEAPSAAEVENARIGANNVTYPTLGDAIRGQVQALQTEITDLQDYIEPTQNLFDVSGLVVGGLTSNGGVNTSATYKTTEYTKVEPNTKYHFNARTALYAFYDSSKTFISPYGYWNAVEGGQDIVSPATAAYIRVSYNVNLNSADELMLYEVTNMISGATFDVGGLTSNGNVNQNTAYKTTGFIAAKPNTTYHFNARTALYAFYDSTQAFISPYGYWNAVEGGQDIASPSNAAYVRVSYNVNLDLQNSLNLYDTSKRIASEEYVPYGIHLPELVLEGNQLLHDFKPYRSGDIHFTIPVNTYVFKQGNSATEYADDVIIRDVESVLRLPTNYTHTGKPTPLIILCHGAGYGVSAVEWGTGNDESDTVTFDVLIDTLVSAGYAVCDTNGYNTTFAQQSWGCPRAVQGYRKLYEYIRANYNVENEVYIYGFSMGGLVALNLADECADIIKCIGLGAPVTHLWGQCWNSAYGASRGWRQASATAFDFSGMSSVTWDTTSSTPNASEQACWDANKYLTYGYDPMGAIVDIDSEIYNLKRFPPIRIWQGTDDDIGMDYTSAFVGSVNNSGGVCSLRQVNGGRHSISYGSNAYVNEEIVRWFNRFRIAD